jgi:hypothetical protein
MKKTLHGKRLQDLWLRLRYKLLYKSTRAGNERTRINRFTGEEKTYQVHPIARLGIKFTEKQINMIEQLQKEDGIDEKDTTR